MNNTSTISIGFSAINIATGKSYIHKIISHKRDGNLWKDELFRLIHYYSPSEIIFHYDVLQALSQHRLLI